MRINISPVIYIFIGIGLGTISVINIPPSYAIGIPIITLFFLIFFINPRFAILSLIFVMPPLNSTIEITRISLEGLTTINLVGGLNLFILIGGVFYIITNKIKVFKLPIGKSSLIFLIICLISVFISYDIMTGIKRWFTITSPFIIYVLITDLFKNRKYVGRLINITILSMIISCIVGYYQFLTNINMFDMTGNYRIAGTFKHPNLFGFYLTLVLPITMTLSFYYPKFSLEKLGFGIFSLMMILALFLTFSRGSWIGFGIVMLVISTLKYRKILIITSILLIALSSVILLRFQDMSAFMIRILLWEKGLNQFLHHPILGIGLGSFEVEAIQVVGMISHPHNEYIRFATETGILGLSGFLWMLINLIRDTVNTYRKTLEPYFKTVLLAIVAILISYLIMIMNESLYQYVGFMINFYALAAIPYVISNLETEEKNHRLLQN
ncbi:MAG: O-antigen ligase family protein [bacterium]